MSNNHFPIEELFYYSDVKTWLDYNITFAHVVFFTKTTKSSISSKCV